ncbi:MAG: HDOD domain-containing protein [Magnetococcales bacterium]|nr:HDOD domain-containing protein [Magnetococcales bacterium]
MARNIIMVYSETELFALMEEMPAFPHSGFRILQITNDINCPPKELVKVIEQDPIVTMHLLKLVNSEHFGLAKKITSIKQAVVFLGINTMKNLALGIAPMELLTGAKSFPWSLTSILRHSLTTAIIARKLARDLGYTETQATDCYVAGLLHDFGKVALFKLFPGRYEELLKQSENQGIPLSELEVREIAITHTAIGKLLGQRWQLPELLIHSMGGHHDPNLCATSPFLVCVYAANLIADRMHRGPMYKPSTGPSLPPAMLQCLGKDLDTLIASIGLIADEIDRALLLTTIREDGSMAASITHS